jgi:homoserine O-succinyltransferase/O-acetyltransferase
MPIKIPNDLPARATLEREGVMVMSEATTSGRCGSASST